MRLQDFGLSHKQRLKRDCDSHAGDWKASGFCSDPSPEAASDTGVGQMQCEGDKKKRKKKENFQFPEVSLLPECLDKSPSQFKTHPVGFFLNIQK